MVHIREPWMRKKAQFTKLGVKGTESLANGNG
jgi:hypothetical protein